MSFVRRVVLLCTLLVAGTVCTAGATPLRISLPPVLEALPIAFAEAWGMFDEAGINVDVVGITDSQDRSTALFAGSLDAVMSDVTSAVLDYSVSRSVVVVCASGSTPQPGTLRLALLSHVGFGPSDVGGLIEGDARIGVTYRTDDEYLLDRFFAANGRPRAWMTRYSCFSDMLQVAMWFGAKTLSVAILPEPYYSYISTLVPVNGVPANLAVLSDFSEFTAPPRVVVFRQDYVTRHRSDVETFLRVYDAAVERMNATSREEIIDVGLDVVLALFFQTANKALIQQQTLDAMSIPVFDRPAALSQDTFDSLTEWMGDKGYLNQSLSLSEFARFDLLP